MVFVSHHVSQYDLYQAQFLFRNSFFASHNVAQYDLYQVRNDPCFGGGGGNCTEGCKLQVNLNDGSLAVFLHYPISYQGPAKNSPVDTATTNSLIKNSHIIN